MTKLRTLDLSVGTFMDAKGVRAVASAIQTFDDERAGSPAFHLRILAMLPGLDHLRVVGFPLAWLLLPLGLTEEMHNFIRSRQMDQETFEAMKAMLPTFFRYRYEEEEKTGEAMEIGEEEEQDQPHPFKGGVAPPLSLLFFGQRGFNHIFRPLKEFNNNVGGEGQERGGTPDFSPWAMRYHFLCTPLLSWIHEGNEGGIC